MGPLQSTPAKPPTTTPAATTKPQQQQPATSTPAAAKNVVTSPTTPVLVRKRQPKNENATSTDLAILELKLQRERLKKAGDKYEKLSGKMKQMALEAMQADPEKNRATAIQLIKRSKDYERQIDSCSNTLLNLETSINAIEDGIIQQQILNALEGGKNTLDKINKDLSRADEVMESVREAVQQSREIGEILASTVTGPAGVDDIMMMDDSEFEDDLALLMNPNSSSSEKKKNATNKSTDNKTQVVDQVKVPTHTPVPDVAVPNHALLEKTDAEGEAENEQKDEERIAA